MCRASIAVATLAALLFTCSDATPTIVDSEAVVKPNVALVERVSNSRINEASPKRLLTERHARDDSELAQVEYGDRLFGFAGKVKPMLTKGLQSAAMGNAKDVAVISAAESKVQANSFAVRLKEAIDKLLEELKPLWKQMATSPIVIAIKTKLIQIAEGVTDATMTVAASIRMQLDKLALKYEAIVYKYLKALKPIREKLAAHPNVKAFTTKLKEFAKKVSNVKIGEATVGQRFRMAEFKGLHKQKMSLEDVRVLLRTDTDFQSEKETKLKQYSVFRQQALRKTHDTADV